MLCSFFTVVYFEFMYCNKINCFIYIFKFGLYSVMNRIVIMIIIIIILRYHTLNLLRTGSGRAILMVLLLNNCPKS